MAINVLFIDGDSYKTFLVSVEQVTGLVKERNEYRSLLEEIVREASRNDEQSGLAWIRSETLHKARHLIAAHN